MSKTTAGANCNPSILQFRLPARKPLTISTPRALCVLFRQLSRTMQLSLCGSSKPPEPSLYKSFLFSLIDGGEAACNLYCMHPGINGQYDVFIIRR